MIEFRAIQRFLVVVVVGIFAFSTAAALVSGNGVFVSAFWSFMNIIGASFPPNNSLVDPTNPLLFVANVLDIQGRLVITIVLTTVFYQLLGRINFREKVVQRKIAQMSGHIVIVPMDGIAVEITRQLGEKRMPFTVIEQDPKVMRRMMSEGIAVIGGDPEQPDALKAARIEKASFLLLLDEDDVRNTLIAIEAKRLNPSIRVIARIKRQDDIARMRRAGIDRLILPEVAVGDEVASFLVKVPSNMAT
ncbi:MAG: NAD-binding protein [Candidatus Micrarchaeota archaeon]|nr:NAD-binding protein [Candidatus Micrarchaeota archaeon]